MCHRPELNGPIAICSRMKLETVRLKPIEIAAYTRIPCCTYMQIIMHVKSKHLHVISSILDGLLEYYMNLEFYQRMVAMAAKDNCHVQRSLLWIGR